MANDSDKETRRVHSLFAALYGAGVREIIFAPAMIAPAKGGFLVDLRPVLDCFEELGRSHQNS